MRQTTNHAVIPEANDENSHSSPDLSGVGIIQQNAASRSKSKDVVKSSQSSFKLCRRLSSGGDDPSEIKRRERSQESSSISSIQIIRESIESLRVHAVSTFNQFKDMQAPSEEKRKVQEALSALSNLDRPMILSSSFLRESKDEEIKVADFQQKKSFIPPPPPPPIQGFTQTLGSYIPPPPPII